MYPAELLEAHRPYEPHRMSERKDLRNPLHRFRKRVEREHHPREEEHRGEEPREIEVELVDVSHERRDEKRDR